MCEDGGSAQRGMRNHPSCNTMHALKVVRRPNLRAQKPEASLHQPVVQMRKNNVVAVLGHIRVKGDRSLDVGVRVFETDATFLPAWVAEIRNTKRARAAIKRRRDQLGLARKVEGNVN